jgi:hypothetical protein
MMFAFVVKLLLLLLLFYIFKLFYYNNFKKYKNIYILIYIKKIEKTKTTINN